MTLSKDAILEANDLKTEVVEVAEWGGSVNVRTMTGADRDAFEASLFVMQADGTRKPSVANMRPRLAALTIVDDAGNRMFAEADVEALARKSAAALEKVCVVAQRLNGIGWQAEDAAAKNSEAGPSEGSTSA